MQRFQAYTTLTVNKGQILNIVADEPYVKYPLLAYPNPNVYRSKHYAFYQVY